MSWESARGAHAGQHAAIVCPGPSVDLIEDFAATLAPYDLRIFINEALLLLPEAADYLTCFDVKGARKTLHIWPPGLPIVCLQWPSEEIRKYRLPNPLIVVPDGVTLTDSHSGSLGKALGFAKHLGVASIDLYGVDLCRPPKQHYAKSVLERRRQSFEIHENLGNARRRKDGKLVPDHFQRFARQIEMHKHEWEGIRIVNKCPWSLLDAFPKG